MSRITVLVVDDHALFRRGLVEVLAEESDIEVVGEAADGHEAIEKAASLRPDVVFMDLNMPGQDGITSTAYLTQRWPDMKVLILTVSEEPSDLFDVLRVGARGYVVKTASTVEIADALRQVHQGWVVLSPAMAPRFLADLAQPSGPRPAPQSAQGKEAAAWQLTNRELEVLQLVARHLSNVEVASALVISENTVKTHIKSILSKLQAKSRREALVQAERFGLLEDNPEDTFRRRR